MRWVPVSGIALVCGLAAGCSGKTGQQVWLPNASGGGSGAPTGHGGTVVGSGGQEPARGGSSSGGSSANGGAGSAHGGVEAGGSTGGMSQAGGSGGVSQAGGSGGEPSAGAAGANGSLCEPGEVRCLSRRERCTSEGIWATEDYVCTLDLDGVTEQNLFCAVKATGSITCWGDDFRLQQVQPIPDGNWRRVFLTDDFASTNICALDDQSDALCWGPGGVRIFRGPLRDIAVGEHGIFTILGDDGRLYARDLLSVKEALGSEPAGPFVRLAINDNQLFALAANGAIHGLVPFPNGVYKELALSNAGTCAIDAGDHVLCNPAERADPTLANERFVAIEQQDVGSACGITIDGTVRCWDQGAVEPLKPPSGKFKRLAAGATGMCGLRVDGSVTCWGANAKMPPDGV